MLYEGAVMDWEKGWTRTNFTTALSVIIIRVYSNNCGPDTGFDSIGDFTIAAKAMSRFDKLDTDNKLAKTILYNLNPRDTDLIATMIGNFQDGSVAGKIQFGSGWWFL